MLLRTRASCPRLASARTLKSRALNRWASASSLPSLLPADLGDVHLHPGPGLVVAADAFQDRVRLAGPILGLVEAVQLAGGEHEVGGGLGLEVVVTAGLGLPDRLLEHRVAGLGTADERVDLPAQREGFGQAGAVACPARGVDELVEARGRQVLTTAVVQRLGVGDSAPDALDLGASGGVFGRRQHRAQEAQVGAALERHERVARGDRVADHLAVGALEQRRQRLDPVEPVGEARHPQIQHLRRLLAADVRRLAGLGVHRRSRPPR